MNEETQLLNIKTHLTEKYLGKFGVHGVGLRTKGLIILHDGNHVPYEDIRREATPFVVQFLKTAPAHAVYE